MSMIKKLYNKLMKKQVEPTIKENEDIGMTIPKTSINTIPGYDATNTTTTTYPYTTSGSIATSAQYTFPIHPNMTSTVATPSTTYTSVIGTTGLSGQVLTSMGPVTQSYWTTPTIGTNPVIHPIITLSNNSKEIVRIEVSGKVIWANGVDVDEAAQAFAKSMHIGAEMAAGLTEYAKRAIRDKLFAEIIDFAKEKGPLSAHDLQYIFDATKIMEKLSNIK